ncbi:hypothetical protein [Kitasatospora sp. A2-31]|uniref:hypothetical protein n=1 Tax=Kitasatospora sp. A2-31 TaxID=2916414 RepID=UPI0035AB9701
MFALVLAIAAGLPLLVETAGLPSTLPGLGTILAVAGAVTRVMALPLVDSWLPSWLRKASAQPDPLAPPTWTRE